MADPLSSWGSDVLRGAEGRRRGACSVGVIPEDPPIDEDLSLVDEGLMDGAEERELPPFKPVRDGPRPPGRFAGSPSASIFLRSD